MVKPNPIGAEQTRPERRQVEDPQRNLCGDCSSDGDAVGAAYRKGIDAGKRFSLTNPDMKTLDERLAFRHGWMRGMKEQNADT